MWILIAFVSGIAALGVAGVIYQAWGLRHDARVLPPPGRLIQLDTGRRLHLFEMGGGSPAVVLESGISATSLNWRRVQEGIAGFTRAVAYDRAGLGWSSRCEQDRVPSTIAGELREMLRKAGVQPPYVLVAHSFGALVVRWYASHYPREVAGVVLVDPVWPEQWTPVSAHQRRMLALGAKLCRRGAFLARIGAVRIALSSLMSGSRLLPRAIGRAAGGRGMGVMDRLAGEVGKMPRELWPMVMAHWCNPKSFTGMAAHLQCLLAGIDEVSGFAALPGIPVTVLTGARNRPAPAGAVRAIAADARHIVAEHSGHWIHLDEPELVIQAVREMITGA